SDNCSLAPCDFPAAVIVNVSSSVSGTRVPGAFISVNGADIDPCNQAETTVCTVYGATGTYQLHIGAPNLSSVDTTVSFTATQSSACGCQTGTPATISVTLVPVS